MTRRPGQPLLVIELTRFVCAMGVMACHYGVGFWRAPGARPAVLLHGIDYRAPGEDLLQFGWLGVEIFFVISGMMIARSAVGSDAGAFLRRRVLRLAPAAWVCGTITLAVLTAGLGPSGALFAAWGRSLAFWPTGQQIDAAYWTLGIELAFYLAIAACLGTGGSARRVERAGAAIGLASGAFWLGCLAIGPAAAWLFTHRMLQLLLLPYGCFFALGIAIARCHAAGVTPLRAFALVGLIAICGIEVAVHATESANESGLPVAAGPALAIFAVAVAAMLLAERAQPWLVRWITPAAARTAGLMTYPLYLVHQEAGAVLVRALTTAGIATGPALLASAAAALVTAWAVARFAEPPVLRWLAARLSRARATPAATPALAAPG